MLPWFLCAHMLGDYGRPFKQAVDEIIRALWAMYWHHKHCALSCPLRRVMLVIFLKSVKVRFASLTQVNCSGSYWTLPWINLPSKRWWWAAILTNAKCFFIYIMYITSLTAAWVLFESLYTVWQSCNSNTCCYVLCFWWQQRNMAVCHAKIFADKARKKIQKKTLALVAQINRIL